MDAGVAWGAGRSKSRPGKGGKAHRNSLADSISGLLRQDGCFMFDRRPRTRVWVSKGCTRLGRTSGQKEVSGSVVMVIMITVRAVLGCGEAMGGC